MRSAVIVLLAGLLVAAYASCPNQCSGHGRCGANDKCTCYTQVNTPWGNRYMYTGADCSERTCPLGVAPDAIANYPEIVGPIGLSAFDTVNSVANQRSLSGAGTSSLHAYLAQELQLPGPDVTFNVLVATYSSGSGTFQWKYEADTEYSLPIAFTTRSAGAAPTDGTDSMLLDPPQALGTYPGNGQTETGIRIWFDSTSVVVGDVYTVTVSRATGFHWVISNDNTLHQPQECSARGLCDGTTGKCKCFVGFGGEACQRTTCPNDCSGHGVCQAEFQFRADATALGLTSGSYGSIYDFYTDPFDAQRQMGCKCDLGYRGPDCSEIECPSGTDPLTNEEPNNVAQDCSGRGICDYSIGQCKCFKGYFGERCETQTNFV